MQTIYNYKALPSILKSYEYYRLGSAVFRLLIQQIRKFTSVTSKRSFDSVFLLKGGLCYTVIAPWYVYYPLPFTFKGRTNLSVILKPIVWQTSSHSTLGHNGLWNHLCYRPWNPQRHCTRGTKLSTETQRNLFLREEGRGVVKLQIINLKFLFCADFGNKVL